MTTTVIGLILSTLKNRSLYYYFESRKIRITKVNGYQTHTGNIIVTNECGAMMPMSLEDTFVEEGF